MAKNQRQVLANVTRRGYVNGWTPEQFILRQLVKLLEEAAELFLSYQWPNSMQMNHLHELAAIMDRQAELVFDDESLWRLLDMPLNNELDKIQEEAADVMVVLCCLAEMMKEVSGRHFNLLESAIEKSAGDVKRGKRNK